MIRRLRSLARAWLNALEGVVEVRGGVMLSMPVSEVGACDGVAALGCIDDPAQIKQGWKLHHQAAARRLQQGHVLYYLEDHGVLCSYCWVSRAGTTNDVFFGRLFKVPQAAIYIWDCATVPAYRKRGYYKAVLKGIQSLEPGISSAYVAVDQLNHVSRRALEWAGFKICFRYWGVRILRRRAVCIALWGRRLLPLKQALAGLTQPAVTAV